MKIDIVAATSLEFEAIKNYRSAKHEIRLSVHGIGMMATLFHLQKIAENKPDLIVQCGIAGSFSPDFEIGNTVLVGSEMADIGAEDDIQLLTLFDLGFLQANDFPYADGLLHCPFLQKNQFSLPIVRGLTVNCSSGCQSTIEKRINKFSASIETMEGAALHYVGLMTNTPFLQIRTISNMVEKRDKTKWDIQLALKNNALELINILDQLNNEA